LSVSTGRNRFAIRQEITAGIIAAGMAKRKGPLPVTARSVRRMVAKTARSANQAIDIRQEAG